jgi:hypothetical protein
MARATFCSWRYAMISRIVKAPAAPGAPPPASALRCQRRLEIEEGLLDSMQERGLEFDAGALVPAAVGMAGAPADRVGWALVFGR